MASHHLAIRQTQCKCHKSRAGKQAAAMRQHTKAAMRQHTKAPALLQLTAMVEMMLFNKVGRPHHLHHLASPGYRPPGSFKVHDGMTC